MRRRNCEHRKIHRGYGRAFGGMGAYSSCENCGALLYKEREDSNEAIVEMFIANGYDVVNNTYTKPTGPKKYLPYDQSLNVDPEQKS